MIRLLFKIWLAILFVSEICTLGIVCVVSLISGSSITETGEEINYAPLLVALCALYVLVLSAGATTLFLNNSKKVRNNKLLRLLSFFLVPLTILTMDIHSRWGTDDVNIIPLVYGSFFLCLTVAYVWFSRKLKKQHDVL